jgi:hypothetical protein
LLNGIHISRVACTVSRLFWIKVYPASFLSHVVYYVLHVVTTPLRFPLVMATPFVNIYTAYEQKLQGMLEYTLHTITLTWKSVE